MRNGLFRAETVVSSVLFFEESESVIPGEQTLQVEAEEPEPGTFLPETATDQGGG